MRINQSFVQGLGIYLSPEDLAFGLRNHYFDEADVVSQATVELSDARAASDELLQALGHLLNANRTEVPFLLEGLADPERVSDPRETHRKWLFILLSWLFENRAVFDDPLGQIEEIFADYDYPDSISALVRYMPAEPTLDKGPGAIMERWQTFLVNEGAALRADFGTT